MPCLTSAASRWIGCSISLRYISAASRRIWCSMKAAVSPLHLGCISPDLVQHEGDAGDAEDEVLLPSQHDGAVHAAEEDRAVRERGACREVSRKCPGSVQEVSRKCLIERFEGLVFLATNRPQVSRKCLGSV